MELDISTTCGGDEETIFFSISQGEEKVGGGKVTIVVITVFHCEVHLLLAA